jgi:hypothetical protein
MLLTDRDCISFDDLVAIEPEVGEIAAAENIPTEGDRSVVHHAVEEAGNRLLAVMQNFSYPYFNGMNGDFLQAGIMYGYFDSTPPARIKLGMVVTDSDTSTFASPLKRWITYIALRNFYQRASNRLQGDRYDNKKKQIQADIDNIYWPTLKACGLPVVYNPIPCPGAHYEVGQGVWSADNLSAVNAMASGGTFDVAVTWLGQVESGPSTTETVTIESNNALHVDITSLTPPSGVTSWNLFVGNTGGTLYKQTTLPIGTTSYTLPTDPVLSGTAVGIGQPRDTNLVFINLFSRA